MSDGAPAEQPGGLAGGRGPRRRLVRLAAAALVIIALLAVGLAGLWLVARGPAGSAGPTVSTGASASPRASATAAAVPLTHVHLSGSGYGIAFDHPSDWLTVPFVLFELVAYTNGDPNHVVDQGRCCYLEPAQFLVGISASMATPMDMGIYSSNAPAGAVVRSVGDWLVVKLDMPITSGQTTIDVHTLWLIGRPGQGQRVYSVSAIFRGPNLATMQAQMDAFVTSITLDPEPAASPS
jgi:hypothetical protein